MGEHARLSPSGAHRWMACPASLMEEEKLPPEEGQSKYAAEGTAAHELAEKVLRLKDPEPEDVFDFEGDVAENGHEFTRSMCDSVKPYIKNILEYSEGNYLYVEEKVDFSNIIDHELRDKLNTLARDANRPSPEVTAFGTADAIIITADNTELQIHDLKFGMGVRVEATENKQLMLYALGALEKFDTLDMVENVRLVIHQPRLYHLSEWVCPVAQLRQFAQEASTAAGKALKLAENDPTMDPKYYFNSGPEQCRWCKVKDTCRAVAENISQVMGLQFEDLTKAAEIEKKTSIVSTVTSNEFLAEALPVLDLIVDWTKAVRARATHELLIGNTIPGYKLVKGKKSARKWKDEKEAETMLKSMRVKQAEMYKTSLITPTAAEKVLKPNPGKWERLQEVITQTEGQPSIAAADDKRPEYTPEALFEDNTNSIDDLI